MSTLVFFRAHEPLGRKRKDQKRGAKIQDDPEAARQQRLDYQNMCRKQKREQILEERRKVMQSLGWMTIVGNDELEKWNQNDDTPPERLLQALTYSRDPAGARQLLSSMSSDVIPLMFHFMEKSLHLDIVLEIIANLMEADPSFALHVANPEFMVRMEIMSRDATSITQFQLCRLVAFMAGLLPSLIADLHSSRMVSYIQEVLFFGAGDAKHQAIRFLSVVANTASGDMICAIFDNDMLDAMESALTDDVDTAFSAMEVLQKLFNRRNQVPEVVQIIVRVDDRLHRALDRLFESENMHISALAAILQDHIQDCT
jgi:hypothetical protein